MLFPIFVAFTVIEFKFHIGILNISILYLLSIKRLGIRFKKGRNLGLWRFNPAIRRAPSDQVFEKLLNTPFHAHPSARCLSAVNRHNSFPHAGKRQVLLEGRIKKGKQSSFETPFPLGKNLF
jgi:hypothetical protein